MKSAAEPPFRLLDGAQTCSIRSIIGWRETPPKRKTSTILRYRAYLREGA